MREPVCEREQRRMSVAERGQKRQNASTDVAIANKRTRLPTSVYKQQILNEDDYTEALARIIRRDFFPDLDAAVKYEEARKRRQVLESFADIDPSSGNWTARTARTRRGDWTPGETPLRTPLHAAPTHPASASGALDDQGDDYEGVSLTDFLSKYTSEDNASFAEILQRNNEARRQKYAWAYAKEEAENARQQRATLARQHLIECINIAIEQSETGEVGLIEGVEAGKPGERLVVEHGRTAVVGDRLSIENAKHRLATGENTAKMIEAASTQNLLEGSSDSTQKRIEASATDDKDDATTSQTPEDTSNQQLAVIQNEAQTQPQPGPTTDRIRASDIDNGIVDGWKYRTRNNLMFGPDSDRPLTEAPRALLSREDEEALGITAPRAIAHSNTRLIQSSSVLVPPSPTRSNIAAAISGTPYPSRDGMTPRVNGYSFVDAQPEVDPSTLGKQVINKQLMTFGTLAATPVALRAIDSDEPADVQPSSSSNPNYGQFKIPATPRREEIADKLARKASKSLAGRHGVSLPTLQSAARNRLAGSLTPSTSAASVYNGGDATPRKSEHALTPAAKSLLGKTGVMSHRDTSMFSGSKAADEARRAKQREKEARERINKARWDTPASSRGGL